MIHWSQEMENRSSERCMFTGSWSYSTASQKVSSNPLKPEALCRPSNLSSQKSLADISFHHLQRRVVRLSLKSRFGTVPAYWLNLGPFTNLPFGYRQAIYFDLKSSFDLFMWVASKVLERESFIVNNAFAWHDSSSRYESKGVVFKANQRYPNIIIHDMAWHLISPPHCSDTHLPLPSLPSRLNRNLLGPLNGKSSWRHSAYDWNFLGPRHHLKTKMARAKLVNRSNWLHQCLLSKDLWISMKFLRRFLDISQQRGAWNLPFFATCLYSQGPLEAIRNMCLSFGGWGKKKKGFGCQSWKKNTRKNPRTVDPNSFQASEIFFDWEDKVSMKRSTPRNRRKLEWTQVKSDCRNTWTLLCKHQ